MQLVLDTKGLTLSKKNGIFHVFDEKRERLISPGKLDSIAITASVLLDSSAVTLAVKHEIPIFFINRVGRVEAKMWSPHFPSIATLRRMQATFSAQEEATAWMIDLFELKTQGQMATLNWIKNKRTRLGLGLSTALSTIKSNNRFEDFRGQLLPFCQKNMMGMEGALAATYWSAIGKSMDRLFRFKKRSRQPAEDYFNAALNYLYGMLYTVVEGGVWAAGLDPQLGLLHADAYKKPTLVFDLIEPFRPWVDQLLVIACFEKKISKKFFSKNQYGLFLNKEGKAFIIPLFNDFLRSKRVFLGQEANHKNHIHFLCAKLAQRIRTVNS